MSELNKPIDETESEQEVSNTEAGKSSRASDRFGAGGSSAPPPLTHVSEKGAGSDHQVPGEGERGGSGRNRPQSDFVGEPSTAETRLGRLLGSDDGGVRPTNGPNAGHDWSERFGQSADHGWSGQFETYSLFGDTERAHAQSKQNQ